MSNKYTVYDFELPAVHKSVIQLYCSACGSETNATCSCGQPYVPATKRAEEYARDNPSASVREIEEKTGVGHGTAQRAKDRCTTGTPETVTGRDGKTYPSKKAASLEHGRKQAARLKKYYGDDNSGLPPVQKDLLEEAKRVVNLMNWSTKQVFAQWLPIAYEK